MVSYHLGSELLSRHIKFAKWLLNFCTLPNPKIVRRKGGCYPFFFFFFWGGGGGGGGGEGIGSSPTNIMQAEKFITTGS